jgi:glycosyltransferase involved in cell wall biosynthesis
MNAPWTIVCFSGVDWASHRQRPHMLMTALAEQGADVLFVDNLGTRMPRLQDAGRIVRRLGGWVRSSGSGRGPAAPRTASEERSGPGRLRVDSPVVLPMQHLGPVRRLGRSTLVRRIRRRIGARRPLVVWTYLPLPVIADTAEALGADALVYDWSDDASEHVLSRSAAERRRIGAWEREMAGRADLVFMASAELLRTRGSANPRTHLVPHGAPRRAGRTAEPPELSGLPRPRIGFVGSITEWTDLDLVDDVARERPDWSFVMVGPVKTKAKALQRRPNVVFTGERPHESIPAYLSAFDVAIIPYRVTPATTAASPVKLREYLAADLPVVSVDVPEVRPFVPPVRVASDAAGFIEAIDACLAERPAPGGDPARTRTRAETWDDRAREMAGRITQLLQTRQPR